jgi:PIN domain nuclease of toxin-antitoxin system
MRFLLDTHTFLWFIQDDPQLSLLARSRIEDSANELFISAATCWEIAIKVSIGKLTLTEPFRELIPREIVDNLINLLPIEVRHATTFAELSAHHRDPFDRMLIAQALTDDLIVLGVDAAFDGYGVRREW